MTSKQYREFIGQAGESSEHSKYHNKKTVVDGIMFDSRKEANRYGELKILKKIGEIKDLILQPQYILQPPFERNGKKIRGISYISDFQYVIVKTGITIVEDCKGMKTDVYKLKSKMFLYKYPNLILKET